MSHTKEIELNVEVIEAKHTVEYITEYINAYMNSEFDIICVELNNGNKIIAMVPLLENSDIYYDLSVLSMPVHLVETVTQEDDYSYKTSLNMYSYHNIASECSELILGDIPAVTFVPKTLAINSYMSYWNSLRDYYNNILNSENKDSDIKNHFTLSTTKS